MKSKGIKTSNLFLFIQRLALNYILKIPDETNLSTLGNMIFHKVPELFRSCIKDYPTVNNFTTKFFLIC